MEGQERNLRKVRTGEVVSTKMEKTLRSIPVIKRLFTIRRSLKYTMRRVRPV